MDAALLAVLMLVLPFVLAVLAIPLERAWPVSPHALASRRRSVGLFVFAAISYAIVHFAMGVLQAGIVAAASPFQFMTLANLPIPTWLGFVLCFLLIDLLHYVLHVSSHLAPILWRLHKVHHADDELSALSGLVHHPFEMLYVTIISLGFFVLVGMPIVVIMAYSAVVGLHAVFSHLNLRIPASVSRWIGQLIVLPEFHRVHHSVRLEEANGNYGTLFAFWDRIFGTVSNAPVHAAARMKFGLPRSEMKSPLTIPALAVLPFQLAQTISAPRASTRIHRKKRK